MSYNEREGDAIIGRNGITIGSYIEFGDSSASVSAAGKLLSDRYFNQNGHDVFFIGESDSSRVSVGILSDGTLNFNKFGISEGDSFMTVQPLQSDQNNVPFNFTIFKADNAGSLRDNAVFGMGWNLSAGGMEVIPGQTAIGIFIEDHYEPVSGQDASEFHIVFVDKLGVQARPFTLYMDKDDITLHSLALQVPTLEFRDPNHSNNPYVRFEQSAADILRVKLLVPAANKGLYFDINSTNNQVQIVNQGLTSPELTLTSFDLTAIKKLQITNSYGGEADKILGTVNSNGTVERVSLTGADFDLTSNVLSLKTVSGVAGVHANPTSITVDSKGRITAIS